MNISHFFIDRPIFAAVLSIVITLVGGVAYFSLPVAQYPEIAPPTIVGHAPPIRAPPPRSSPTPSPRRSSRRSTASRTCSTCPRSRPATAAMSLTVTFKLGTDLDIAQVLVQNRVAIAEPRLPEEVRQHRRHGARRSSPDLLMVDPPASRPTTRATSSTSPTTRRCRCKDVLARLDGVGDVTLFGARDYAMRIWLDPDKLAARDLTAGDVVDALRGAERAGRGGRARPAAGAATGRLPAQRRDARAGSPTRGQFANIIVKIGAGRARDARPRRRPRRARRRRTTSPTAISTSAPAVAAAASSSARAPTRLRPPTAVQATMEELAQELPAGPRLRHRLQPDRVHRANRSSEVDQDAPRGGHPRRRRGHPVPADLARRDHPDRRHPGVADRHLRRDGRARLLAQQPVAVRPGAGDRHRGRRRHRRGRERRAQHRAGHDARARRRTAPWTRSAAR